jgi:hypothetical protein
MAKAIGTGSSFTTPTGHNVCVDRATVSVSQSLVNVTCFGDTFEDNIGGLKRGAVSFEGTPQYNAVSTAPGLPNISGTGGAFTFVVAPSCTISGTMIISDASISSDVSGAVRASYSGVTAGALTESWDETA